jgi:hypothetical protein
MKTTNFKLAIAALTVSAFFATMPTVKTLANNTNPVAVNAVKPTISVKSLGSQDEFVILQITLNQPLDQYSKLEINDDKGVNMYEENVSGKTFTRKIKLVPSELGKVEIVFSTPSAETKKVYQINVAQTSKVDVTEVAKF